MVDTLQKLAKNTKSFQELRRNEMHQKICSSCKQPFPATPEYFFRDKMRKDSLYPQCKSCRKIYYQSEAGKAAHKRYRQSENGRRYQEIYALTRKESMASYNKEYRQTEKGKEVHRKAEQKYRTLYPEKMKAHNIVSRALAIGELVRPDRCENCFEKCFTEAHHKDYSKPFDVNWLCNKCHSAMRKKGKVLSLLS